MQQKSNYLCLKVRFRHVRKRHLIGIVYFWPLEIIVARKLYELAVNPLSAEFFDKFGYIFIVMDTE